jgi:hypothetical protein
MTQVIEITKVNSFVRDESQPPTFPRFPAAPAVTDTLLI